MSTLELFDELPPEAERSTYLDNLITTCRMAIGHRNSQLKNGVLEQVAVFMDGQERRSSNPGPVASRRFQCLLAMDDEAPDTDKETALTNALDYLTLCQKRRLAGHNGGKKSADRPRDEKGRLIPVSKQTSNQNPKQVTKQLPNQSAKQTPNQNPNREGKGREGMGGKKRGEIFTLSTAENLIPNPDMKPPMRAVADAVASAPQGVSIKLPKENQPKKTKPPAPAGTRDVISAWADEYSAVYGTPPSQGLQSGQEIGAAKNLAKDYGQNAAAKLRTAMRLYLEHQEARGHGASLFKFRMDAPAFMDGREVVESKAKKKNGPPGMKSLEEIEAAKEARRKNRQDKNAPPLRVVGGEK
jgi:hypothetical protein